MLSLFCPHTAFNVFPVVDHSRYWENSPKIISHHVPSLSRDFFLIYQISECISDILSLSSALLIPDELMCIWCSRWSWGDYIGVKALWCKDHCFFLAPYFSFTSPSHLLHSVTVCITSFSAPFSRPRTFLSDFHSVLSPGGVRAGLLCPLRVGRVFKLYCSW